MLVEDCKGSVRELLRVIKWMRNCFRKKPFAQHIKEMIKSQFNKLDHLHEADIINLPDSDGNIIETVLSKVVDVTTRP